MRIITGSAKGCRLKAPKGMNTRPTTDRVKESLFSILGGDVLQANVLDLFAGTGNLGLEALSRGAARAVFVDYSAESIRIIRDNAVHTRMEAATQVIKSDVFAALGRLKRQGAQFDLVFCDPPYSRGLAERVLETLDASEILAENALLVIEHDRRDNIDLPLRCIRLKRRQVYGATAISFFVFSRKNSALDVVEEA